ncbi:MAG: hypothetical protein ACYTKD_16965 [Planctomycetota bacterium]|jgi:hypothetical protein
MSEYAKKFAKYLPMGGFPQKKGAALQVSISKLKSGSTRLFVEMAPQTKAKPPSGSSASPFDWDQKIFIALKEEEVGKLLALFRNRLSKVDIIHKYPMDAPPEQQKTTTLRLTAGDYNGVPNWGVQLRQAMGKEKPQQEQLYLQPEDVEILMVILQTCVQRMYNL